MQRQFPLILAGVVAVVVIFLLWQQLAQMGDQMEVLGEQVEALGERAKVAEGQAAAAREAAEKAESEAEAAAQRAGEAEAREQESVARARQAEEARRTAIRDQQLEAAARQAERLKAEEAELARLAAEEERARVEAERARLEAERVETERRADAARTEAAQAKAEAEASRQRFEGKLDRLQSALGKIANTRREALGLVMTLDGRQIEFDFNKADLRPENRELISRIAGVLLTYENFGLQIFGHTDDVGSEEYNQRLSLQRAERVRDYLIEAGIASDVISTQGLGKRSPLVEGTDPASRQRNRRVELAIVFAEEEHAVAIEGAPPGS